ncbi:Hsp70 family protein [Actinoplanes sp. NPDC051470]|uniref:Hsp70 family protein n=1 Tax=Actinoplanes sp. NPDC051470 TaxID=3157224 RepID=UPI003412C019
MTYALGIDCGTTHTAAAISRDGSVEVLRLGARRAELPSLVFVAPDGTTVIGDAAARRGESLPGRLVREFKRRIGDPVPILAGGSPFSAHALTARVLEHVLRAAVTTQGGPPGSMVLTCPANWGPYKRDLLVQAARLADLPPVALRTEPEAAAIEYAAGSRVGDGDIIAVYDLGGGTFDAAVLRRTPGGFEVLGQPEGIEQLGGMDFDEAVFEHVVAALPADRLGAADDPEVLAALARLRRDCVEAKEALSEDTEVLIPVALPQLHTRVRLTRAEFEAMIRPALSDTVGAMRRALRSAGVPAEQVSTFLLSGGSARVPLVSQLLSTEFARPVVLDPHPEHSIALGAARVAAQTPMPQPETAEPTRLVPPAPTAPAPAAPAPTPPAALTGPAVGAFGASPSVSTPPRPETPKPRPGNTYGSRKPEAAPLDARTEPVHPSDAPTEMFKTTPETEVVPAARQPVVSRPPDLPNTDDSPVFLTRAGLDLAAGPPPPADKPPADKPPGGEAGGPRPVSRRALVIVSAAAAVLVVTAIVISIVWFGSGRDDPGGDDQAAGPISTTSACGGFVDEFDGGALDPGWQRTQPGATVAIGGGGATVEAPDGADIYADHTAAPMLVREHSGDFVLEAEVVVQPGQFYQGAGLVVWNSPTSFVRLERGFGDIGAITFEYRDGGDHVRPRPPFKNTKGVVPTDAGHVLLQVRREGDRISAGWREPGNPTYSDLGSAQIDLPGTVRVGLSVLNRAQNGAKPETFSATFSRAALTC